MSTLTKTKKHSSYKRVKKDGSLSQAKEKRKLYKQLNLEKKLKKMLERRTELEVTNEKTIDSLGKGKQYTISIAVPGSILENAQDMTLRTSLAGQIARAVAVFCVQEVIVFSDKHIISSANKKDPSEFKGMGRYGDSSIQMAHILQYLECPQYLRKSFFPQHFNLQYAGLLSPLDCPHHPRESDDIPFREGVVTDRPIKCGRGSYIDVGLTKKFVQVDRVLQTGMRVTVRMEDSVHAEKKKLKGHLVGANVPWKEQGQYWGYTVRVASGLSEVFSESPYKGGYDLTIGTSDKGSSILEASLPNFQHALIVFGGLEGLESALESDERYLTNDPRELFHLYLNTCPSQGTRTIRSEEAIFITMAALQFQIQEVTKR